MFFFRRQCCLVHNMIVLWAAVSDCCNIGNDPLCRSNMNSDTVICINQTFVICFLT